MASSFYKIALLSFLTTSQIAIADTQEKGNWHIETSVYTTHFHPKPEHNNHQDLIGIDYNFPSKWFIGGATFRNSFRQRSFYVYAGKRYQLENTPFYARLSGGLIQGYHGKYKNKIPLNNLGIAPAIIPGAGIQIKRVNAEAFLLGFNALMVNVGYSF
ncbi:sn-glycerol-3-phosphate transporter [Gammaproteobacteria bacterium ESL0073]|nr:sn-glycerol-3-phosphate transporter [Gammaproteobacteria bacterium ESL0073]